VKTIKKLIDQMMVIFPFEKGLYTEKQIPVEYVGHPLLDEINEALNGFDRNAFRKKLGLAPQISCVALLPGSRTSEIRHHLPLFRTTVEELLRADSSLRFVVPVAPTLKLESFAAGLSGSTAFSVVKDGETPHNSHPWVRLTHENATRVLAASDAAMVASGTSTLQAALLQIPLVVVYRVSPFSYWAYNTFFRRLPFVGLPNIVLGRGVVPEMIQKQFQPKRVAQEVLSLLQDSSRRTAVLRDLAQLRSVMEAAEKSETAQKMEAAQGGASHRAARVLLQQLKKDKSCYASA
jgi:lipid-A-disaccharide synthase